MLSCTLPAIDGHRTLEVYGLVTGTAVRTRNEAVSSVANFMAKFGGKSNSYNALVQATVQSALDKMEEAATEAKANTILSVVVTMASVLIDGEDALQVIAMGTAVLLD